jgi:lipid A oxidase
MKRTPSLLALLIVLLPAAGRAEVEIVLAGGKASIANTDLELSRPDGTELTFRSVSWRDESFRTPLYWSLRANWWRSAERGWGLGVDLTHPKAIAETDRMATVRGRRAGAPVSGTERIGDTLQHFELSHGLNTFTLNLLRRWSPGRLQPYVGLGAGVAVPHVEAVIGGDRTGEYQWAGPAFEGRLGLALRLSKHLSAVTEYKLTYARVSVDLEGGGTVDLEPRLHQWVVGLSVKP